ncbi:TonB family protein [uncultured Sunxiuqinia sp.]|uniref:TonB family protein n=1 Tax=uncultured Sunxiuqinia sp. TaxID=1573825 RepID=UPI002AA7C5EC|nr:TonB family protein [uncultured Sunxiuqinia sp.]
MNSFINYILESGVSLGALSLVYFVFLRSETFFKINRLFLLFAILFSSVLPLLHLKVYGAGDQLLFATQQGTNMLDAITVNGSELSHSIVSWITTNQLVLASYIAGAFIITLLGIVRIFQVFRIIRKGQLVKRNGIKYVYIDDNSSPYSFLDYLFVSRQLESTPGWEKMLAHESEHIRQGHTVDILILELISIFQWFNPFFWLLRRVIKENHEFMADHAVLNNGVETSQYKKILVTQFIGNQFSIANNFNSSLIKSRLKMMTKIKSSKKAKFRYLSGIIMTVALVLVFACENKETAILEPETGVQIKSESGEQPLVLIDGEMADMDAMQKLDPASIESVNVVKEKLEVYTQKYGDLAQNGVIEINLKSGATDAKNGSSKDVTVIAYGSESDKQDADVFNIVEQMPEFPGGDLALRKSIAAKVKYPVIAQENGYQGKVYVSFVVEKDGTVGRAKIARGVTPSLDAEAIRVVKNLPRWKPGKQRGQTVAVAYTMPINFVLQ